MKKLVSVLSVCLILILTVTGCKNEAASETVSTAEETATVASEEKSDPAAVDTVEETGETASEAEEEPQEAGTEVVEQPLSFKESFFAGNSSVFKMNEDGSPEQLYKKEGDELIVFAGAGDRYYFYLINDGRMNYTLYYMAEGKDIEKVSLDLKDDASVYRAAVFEDRFYYDYYDADEQGYILYSFDPVTKEQGRDSAMEDLEKALSSYDGRELSNIDYSAFIPDELERTGHIYMKETASGLIYVFDVNGKELNRFDPVLDIESWKYVNDRYLFGYRTEYENNNSKKGHLYCLMYDTETGKNTVIFEGNPNESTLYPVCVKDGYIYYFIEEKEKDGSVKNHKYLREKEENVTSPDRNGESLIDIPVWTGLDNTYISGGEEVYNGFSIRGNKAYYLWFDGEGEDGHRGDVIWYALNMDRLSFDDDTVITDMVEDHALFADYGTIKQEKIIKEEKGIVYCTGSIDRFRFFNDIPNAGKLNKALDELYSRFDDTMEHAEETAHEDIFGSESYYDLEDGWVPTYSYDVTMGEITEVAPGYIQLYFSDYEYFGGAHGMPGEVYTLFDMKNGKEMTMRDLFKGSEEEFRDIVVKYSLDDWKNGGRHVYYEDYDPSIESRMKDDFAECASIGMHIKFESDGIKAIYDPYAVGPYASGFIDIFIPYSELGIEFK